MRSPHRIVADHYAASDRKDIDGMMANLADDVQWTGMAGFPCAAAPVRGPTAARFLCDARTSSVISPPVDPRVDPRGPKEKRASAS